MSYSVLGNESDSDHRFCFDDRICSQAHSQEQDAHGRLGVLAALFGSPGYIGRVSWNCHRGFELDWSTKRGKSGLPGGDLPVADQDILTGSENFQAEFPDHPNDPVGRDISGRGSGKMRVHNEVRFSEYVSTCIKG